MIYFILTLIFSVLGALSGVGSGIILKPLLDFLAVDTLVAITFLSSMTVLSMSFVSIVLHLLRNNGKLGINLNLLLKLAVSSSLGGILGKIAFSYLIDGLMPIDNAGLLQNLIILAMALFTLVYTANEDKIRSLKNENTIIVILIGLFLGILSSFLGIGGGPLNIIAFTYVFGLNRKEAIIASLSVICISQISSILLGLVNNTTPYFNANVLIVMIIAAVVGAYIGSLLHKKFNEKHLKKIFILFLVLVIIVSGYNCLRFLHIL